MMSASNVLLFQYGKKTVALSHALLSKMHCGMSGRGNGCTMCSGVYVSRLASLENAVFMELMWFV